MPVLIVHLQTQKQHIDELTSELEIACRSYGSKEGLLQKQLTETRDALALSRNQVAEQEAAVAKLRDELEREQRTTLVFKVYTHFISRHRVIGTM